jgi:PTH1 family peptidyl-tRNA hydrolase
LGNPGKRYAHSRHNVGKEVVTAFCDRHSIRLRRKRLLHSRVGGCQMGGKKVLAVIPTTFMNISGQAVACAVGYYGVHPKNLLVTVDDVNLPAGQLRIRTKGSDGGHNGLKSVIAWLATADFPRLRIGIGMDDSKSLTEFVLENFEHQEKESVRAAVELSADAVETIIVQGISAAMNKYNQERPTIPNHAPGDAQPHHKNIEGRTGR